MVSQIIPFFCFHTNFVFCFPFFSTGDKFRLVVASTLSLDGYPDGGEFNPSPEQPPSRADNFEYVMYGKIYRIEGDDAPGEATRL